jgi:DNA-binding LytR/AlgR family response regulator
MAITVLKDYSLGLVSPLLCTGFRCLPIALRSAGSVYVKIRKFNDNRYFEATFLMEFPYREKKLRSSSMSSSLPQHFSDSAVSDEQNQSSIETLYQELNSCKRSIEDLFAHQTIVQKQSYLNKMLVKSNGHLIIVHIDDIDWIEAWGDYVRIHCKGKTHIVHQKVVNVEARLDPIRFLRIGRSAIVNVDRIKELEPLNHGDYIISLYDNTQLNLSRNYRDRLTALFVSIL